MFLMTALPHPTSNTKNNNNPLPLSMFNYRTSPHHSVSPQGDSTWLKRSDTYLTLYRLLNNHSTIYMSSCFKHSSLLTKPGAYITHKATDLLAARRDEEGATEFQQGSFKLQTLR